MKYLLFASLVGTAMANDETSQIEAANAVDNVYHISANGYCWWWKDYAGPFTPGNEAFVVGASVAGYATMAGKVEACRDDCSGQFFGIRLNEQKCMCWKPVSDGGPARCEDPTRVDHIPDVESGELVAYTDSDSDPNYRFSHTEYLQGGGLYGIGPDPFADAGGDGGDGGAGDDCDPPPEEPSDFIDKQCCKC